ncbi:MAG: hypothetical protein MI975_15040 [Cytophagales bacterium]|nr:hypothetical protein [Cytophagales bacterium]
MSASDHRVFLPDQRHNGQVIRRSDTEVRQKAVAVDPDRLIIGPGVGVPKR